MDIKVEALVLRTIEYGENDKIITLFSIEHGKITARAKGVKKDRAKLKFSTQPFAFCEYVLAKKGDRYTITNASLLDAFYDIRTDIVKLYTASAITAILDCILYENIVNAELFLYTIQALKILTTGQARQIFISYFLKVLQLSGYALQVDCCATCNAKLQGVVNIDLKSGQFYCRNCHTGAGVSAETIEVLKQAVTGRYIKECCTKEGEIKAIKLLMAYFQEQIDTSCSGIFNDYLQLLNS